LTRWGTPKTQEIKQPEITLTGVKSVYVDYYINDKSTFAPGD